MTQNVVNYLNVREQERTHKAQEAETGRHNRIVEDLSQQQHYETQRHNREQERIAAENVMIAHQQLSHQANVLALQERMHQETQRSNFVQEQLKQQQNALTASYNAGQLRIGQMNASANLSQARTSAGQLLVARAAQQETVRHNKAQVQNQFNIAMDRTYTDMEIARIGSSTKKETTIWQTVGNFFGKVVDVIF